MNMDGSSSMPIIRKSIDSAISSLAVDYGTKTVYWWDSDLKIIESSSYVGNSQRILHRSNDNEVLTGLSFFDHRLYYLEKNSKSVSRIDVTGTSKRIFYEPASKANRNFFRQCTIR